MKRNKTDQSAIFAKSTIIGGREDGRKFLLVPAWLFYGGTGYIILNAIVILGYVATR